MFEKMERIDFKVSLKGKFINLDENKIIRSALEIGNSRIRRRSKEKCRVEIKFSKQGEIVGVSGC